MVKGISRQVIVVHSPEPKLFEQAIFILKDDAVAREGVTDEALVKEAQRLINSSAPKRGKWSFSCLAWAACGAVLTGVLWLISVLL